MKRTSSRRTRGAAASTPRATRDVPAWSSSPARSYGRRPEELEIEQVAVHATLRVEVVVGSASTMRPSWTTRMRSALTTVARRCAMTSAVRPENIWSHGLLEPALGARIDRGGRLVEDQQVRVIHQRPRKTQQLTFAHRQVRAALGERLVVAERQTRNHAVGADRSRARSRAS